MLLGSMCFGRKTIYLFCARRFCMVRCSGVGISLSGYLCLLSALSIGTFASLVLPIAGEPMQSEFISAGVVISPAYNLISVTRSSSSQYTMSALFDILACQSSSVPYYAVKLPNSTRRLSSNNLAFLVNPLKTLQDITAGQRPRTPNR